jgi:hypothetical protein
MCRTVAASSVRRTDWGRSGEHVRWPSLNAHPPADDRGFTPSPRVWRCWPLGQDAAQECQQRLRGVEVGYLA